MKATLTTNLGPINLNFFPNEAPKTVSTIAGLADGTLEYSDDAGRSNPQKFYDGLIFHRIIAGFMIQGGDPLGQGTGGPGFAFDDEIHPDLQFDRPYLLAMANAGKRGGRGTNGSQFFITVTATPHLNGKHTIFGEVADQPSRDLVDTIAAVQTGAADRPVDDVVIESLEIRR